MCLEAVPVHAEASKKQGNSSKKSMDIVAIVGDKSITEKDLETRIKLILVTSHIPVTAENIQSLREQVLKNMIEEYVQVATATKFKVLAKESDITAALAQVAKENKMTLEQLESMLKQNGIHINYLRERMKAQLSWINFVRGAYSHTLHIGEKEIDAYFEKEKENAQKDQFDIYEIFLRADDVSQLPAVEAQAQNLIKQLKAGASFRMLAQQFSNSPSAAKGGYVGWVTKNHEGSKAYEALEPGQVSYPVKTNHGYYIYYLADKKLAGQGSTGDVLVSYKQVTIPLTAGFKPEDDPYLSAHLNELMPAKSVSEFERAAKERDLRIQSVSDRKLSHFPPEFRSFIETLSVGKPSMPSLTPDGMMIMVVYNKKAAEPEKTLSRNEAKGAMESDKLSKIASQNLTQMIGKTYIKLYNPTEFPSLTYGKTAKSL